MTQPHPAAGQITIWQDKYDLGCSGGVDSDGRAVDKHGNRLVLHPALPLADAIAQQHSTDAHFWPGVLVKKDTSEIVPRAPRVNMDGLPLLDSLKLEVRFGAIALDVDDKATHKDHLPASAEWRERQLALLAKLPSALRSGMARYDTKGGYRLVWIIEHAPTIPEFIALLVLLVRQLRKWGIDPDEFRDFGRCYRLPDVVRDGKRQVLDGNGVTPGLLRWTPMLPDFNEVLAVERKKYEHKPRVDRSGDAPRSPGSFDALAMVEAAGREIIGEKLMGAGGTLHVVSPCMCEREEGGTGCAVTIAESGAVGIVCKHASCDYSEHKMAPGSAWKLWRSRHEAGYYTEDDTAGIKEWAEGDWSCYAHNTHAAAEMGTEPASEAAAPERAPFKLGSEKEIAERLCADLEGGGEKMVFDRGEIRRYEPSLGVWSLVDKSVLHKQVASYDSTRITMRPSRDGKPKGATLLVSQKMTVDIAKLACTLSTRLGFFDAAPDGLVFADGFVRVDATGVQLAPHAPEHRALATLPFNYGGSGAAPQMFLRALGEWFTPANEPAKLVQLLREFIGLCLIGKVTKYQKALLLVGEGQNGKGVFMDVMSALFPGPLLSNVTPQMMGKEYSLATLRSSRLNAVSEIPDGDILEAGPVKAAITGDRMEARDPYGGPFFFRPACGHLLAGNNLPAVRDMSHGFWRRWLVVPFLRIYEDSESDKDLADRIIAAEMPGIAAWALEGAATALARGRYDVPAEVDKARADWRHGVDQVSQFVDELCSPVDVTGRSAAGAKVLYNAYRTWAQDAGHTPVMSNVKFGGRLVQLKVPKTRREDGNVYGLALRSAMRLQRVS